MSEDSTNQDTITLTREQLDAIVRQARSDASTPIIPSWLRAAGRYVGARLTEPSTYAGVALAATAFGAQIDPDKFQAIAQLGTMVAGGILAVSRDPGSSA
ncbi:MAG: hypothetical protein H7838_07395 [Magnetococcus sp. DMHC-8]